MSYEFLVGVDWDDDRFICMNARPGDPLNLLPSIYADVLDYTTYNFTDLGFPTGTVQQFSSAAAALGLDYYALNDNSYAAFWNGGTADIDVEPGDIRRFTVWVSPTSGSPTPSIALAIVSDGGGTVAVSNYPSFTPSLFQQMTVVGTAGTAESWYLKVIGTGTTFRTRSSGFMVTAGTAIPVGYNVGEASNLYDNISEYVMDMSWMNGMARPLQRVADEQTATFKLHNNSKLFTPENTSSALYNYIHRGKRVVVRYTSNAGITADQLPQSLASAAMWWGQIESLDVTWTPSGNNTGILDAMLNCAGFKVVLDNLRPNLGLYSNATATTIIQDVLEAANLTNPTPALQNGEVTFADYGDSPQLSGYQIIEEVTEGETGYFYFTRGGQPSLLNRSYFLGDAGTVIAGTVASTGSYKPVNVDYSFADGISNIIRIQINPRYTGGTVTLWELDQPLDVAAGGSVSFEAILRTSNGQYASATALNVDTQTFSAGTATVNITANGGHAVVSVDNSAGGVAATLSALILEGAPVIQQNQAVIEETNATSIADYGMLTHNMTLYALSSIEDAQDRARFELARRSTERGDIYHIEFYNQMNGVDNLHQLQWQFGTKLYLDFPEIDHAGWYFITGERHQAKGLATDHRTTFYLEPQRALPVWRLGVPGLTELGQTTILGF